MGKGSNGSRNSDTERSTGAGMDASALDKKTKCFLCGKMFNTGAYDMSQYAYKVASRVFCSYGHYSEYLRTQEPRSKKRLLF